MDQCDTCGQETCKMCGGCGCMGNECSCGMDDTDGDEEEHGTDEEM